MKNIRYRARRIDKQTVGAGVGFFMDDLADLEDGKEYSAILYVHQLPHEQLELPSLEANDIEWVVEYD